MELQKSDSIRVEERSGGKIAVGPGKSSFSGCDIAGSISCCIDASICQYSFVSCNRSASRPVDIEHHADSGSCKNSRQANSSNSEGGLNLENGKRVAGGDGRLKSIANSFNSFDSSPLIVDSSLGNSHSSKRCSIVCVTVLSMGFDCSGISP